MHKRQPKYQQVFAELEEGILSGRYSPGQKLPSEAALLEEFGTSRITVVRALRELQQRGLVQRRAGSGTYVTAGVPGRTGLLFGLLIPNLGETEIFGPICQSIAEVLQGQKHALLWGNMTPAPAAEAKEAQSLALCRQYLAQKVAGVFFSPLEWTPQNDQVNQAVVAVLEAARIPIILLDRGLLPYPRRSPHDLVSIDHRRAGYLGTEHLVQLGCRRIVFLAYANSAPTIEARVAGYQEALLRAGVAFEPDLVQQLRSNDVREIAQLMQRFKPEALVCANDRTAGHVMRSLLELDYRIPRDVRIVGIDDVQYASLLPVPLTTVHQPCRDLGIAAAAAMLERITVPDLPPRDILLDCRLVMRESCGTPGSGPSNGGRPRTVNGNTREP
ncbi:MAG: GntR family transcriptional regulator [Verrucomicrobia bacterium]|nr:GntR family transcriptional regulator [Verrucomicrobiota bacterium]